MGVAGLISPPGGAPKPDPERVATIRYTIVDEPETCAAFGETARAAVAALNDQALTEARRGDLGECSLLLDHIRDRVAGLDPARLVPRSGLAGLFDSRSKRLKAFRAGYASAASAVTQAAGDIGERAAVLARKDSALETLWSETRDAIAELDAHIAAARSWLANEAPAALEPVAEPEAPVEEAASGPAEDVYQRCEAQADAEALHVPAEDATDTPIAAISEPVEPVESPEIVAEAEAEVAPASVSGPGSAPEPKPVHAPAPVASLPHPLEIRLAALEALRATAIGRLPLLRAAQNADCRTPAALKQVCDGVEAWRADWQDALGLAGKRPKKVAPDRVRLSNATSALTDRIDAAGRELSAAQGRRAELDARSGPAQTEAALAA